MRSETAAALAAVDAAMRVVRRRAGVGQIRSKATGDLVTGTDERAEDVIRDVLMARTPSLPVVGEERGGAAPADGAPHWLVDPICGTHNFAAGLPLCAVNVALVEEEEVRVAVVGDPSSGRRYAAERGRGAWAMTARGEWPLQVSAASGLLLLDMGTTGAARARFAAAAHAAALNPRWSVRVLGSSLAFAYVAAGTAAAHADFWVDHPLHTAAGCLLAEEAGATVTDLEGRPWTLASRSFLVAATPEAHRAVLKVLAGSGEAAFSHETS